MIMMAQNKKFNRVAPLLLTASEVLLKGSVLNYQFADLRTVKTKLWLGGEVSPEPNRNTADNAGT